MAFNLELLTELKRRDPYDGNDDIDDDIVKSTCQLKVH